MTLSYSTHGLHKPDFNHLNWHTPLNELVDLIDETLHGKVQIDVTAGDVTPTTPDGLTGEARHRILEFIGTAGVTRNATFELQQGWWFLQNASDGEIVVKMASGASVTIGIDRQALIFSDGTDMNLMMMWSLSVTEFGQTLGYLSDKSWKFDFDKFDARLWVQFQADGAHTATDKLDADDGGFPSEYGGGYVRMLAQSAYYFAFGLPLNPLALYRIRFRLRQRTNGTTAQNNVHLGVMCLSATGARVGIDGTNSILASNMHSVAADGADLEGLNTYQTYTGYFKGQDAGPTAQGRPSLLAPGTLHEDARYICPMFWVNDDNTNGLVDIASIQIDQLPENTVGDDDAGRLFMPVATVLPVFRTTAPVGWHLCDGSEKEIAGDEALFEEMVNGQSFLGFPTSQVGTFVGDDSGNKIDIIGHGKDEGNRIHLEEVTTLPGALAENTQYFVRNPNVNDMQLSLTPTGSIINITSAGSSDNKAHDFFSVPDLRGRTLIGMDDYGSAAGAADRATDVEADQLGGAEGAEDAWKEHSHGISGSNLEVGATIDGFYDASLDETFSTDLKPTGFRTDNYTINNAGNDASEQHNMQPFLAMGFIIKR